MIRINSCNSLIKKKEFSKPGLLQATAFAMTTDERGFSACLKSLFHGLNTARSVVIANVVKQSI
jgi:hypothetical protein